MTPKERLLLKIVKQLYRSNGLMLETLIDHSSKLPSNEVSKLIDEIEPLSFEIREGMERVFSGSDIVKEAAELMDNMN